MLAFTFWAVAAGALAPLADEAATVVGATVAAGADGEAPPVVAVGRVAVGALPLATEDAAVVCVGAAAAAVVLVAVTGVAVAEPPQALSATRATLARAEARERRSA